VRGTWRYVGIILLSTFLCFMLLVSTFFFKEQGGTQPHFHAHYVQTQFVAFRFECEVLLDLQQQILVS